MRSSERREPGRIIIDVEIISLYIREVYLEAALCATRRQQEGLEVVIEPLCDLLFCSNILSRSVSRFPNPIPRYPIVVHLVMKEEENMNNFDGGENKEKGKE